MYFPFVDHFKILIIFSLDDVWNILRRNLMLIAIEKCRDGCSRGLSHAFKIGENDL